MNDNLSARLGGCRLALAVCAIAIAPLIGCSDATDSDPPAFGTIVVHLTDAPFPFDMVDSAMVTLDSVSVHHVSEDGSGKITIDNDSRRIDLLQLQNGITDTVAASTVPVGTVNQLRLYARDATIHLNDGRSFELALPSGAQSGIKVFPDPPIQVAGDMTTQILLDFDVSRSFQAVPAAPTRVEDINSFSFHPVLRVSNLDLSGEVMGAVLYDEETPEDKTDDTPVANAAVMMFSEETLVGSSSSGEDGTFLIMGLDPGSYRLEVGMLGYGPAEMPVTVVPAGTANVGSIRLSSGF